MLLLQIVIQAPTPPPAPPLPPDLGRFIFQSPPPWVTLPPAFVLISLGLFAACAFVLFPLFRALARRIEGKTADRELRAEIDELRARLQELESGQQHVAELEERLDFAERLLSQQRSADRLPNG